jgi:hypothetical protein
MATALHRTGGANAVVDAIEQLQHDRHATKR